MSYNLFLDDMRQPGDVTWVWIPNVKWEIVRNYNEFVSIVRERGVPDFVAFDHDLADEHYQVMLKECEYASNKNTAFISDDSEQGGLNVTFDYGAEKTGYDCAKWLVDYCADNDRLFPLYEVHSMNPVGTARIHNYIHDARKHLNI